MPIAASSASSYLIRLPFFFPSSRKMPPQKLISRTFLPFFHGLKGLRRGRSFRGSANVVPHPGAPTFVSPPHTGVRSSSLSIQMYNFSTYGDAKCWNCQACLKGKKFYCELCGALQRPKENVNYFEVFGVSQKFDVNLDDLSSRFKNMQMAFHPDKFVNKSKTEMEISEIYSRLLNKAYTTLKEPLKRGLYLLELRKFPHEDQFPLDQEFLHFIMEKNEELDSINNEGTLKRFLRMNNEEINKQIHMISEAFECDNWKEAKINLLKLNYFLNLDTKVKDKQTDMISGK